MTREEQNALGSLIQIVEAAIASGDWVVDGACDLERVLAAGKRAITRASRCGNTTAPLTALPQVIDEQLRNKWTDDERSETVKFAMYCLKTWLYEAREPAPRPTALEALEQAFDHHWSSNSIDCDDEVTMGVLRDIIQRARRAAGEVL